MRELARRDRDDSQERARGQHLERGRDDRCARQGRDPRVDGSGCPGERGEENHGCADGIERSARPDKQRDADKPDRDPCDGAEAEPDPEERTVEHRHEDGHGRDEEGRGAGGDPQLGPGHAPCVPDEQEPADGGCSAPLAPAGALGPEVAAPRRPGVEERARDQEPHREHQERRHRPVR